MLFRGAARVGVGVAIVVSISSMVHIDNGNGFGVLGWRSVCLSLLLVSSADGHENSLRSATNRDSQPPSPPHEQCAD